MMLAVVLAAHVAAHAGGTAAESVCHAGAYRLFDGAYVDVMPSQSAANLRWRMLDGRSGLLEPGDGSAWISTLGWTGRPDGITVRFGACSEGRIEFEGRTGSAIEFDVTESRFDGQGVTLRGRLVLPRGTGAVPIAVLVHGSEADSAIDRNHRQYLYPAHGVGVFVYDKRGTGGSTGTYSQDFHALAADAASALREARRLAGKRASRIGFDGGSQGGWVAPLAAMRVDADFISIGYGMAEGPLAEEREQVMRELAAAGYGADVRAKAREVTDATGLIQASGYTRGLDQLDRARAKYAREPWWGAIRGEFTGELAAHTGAEIRAAGPQGGSGTTWGYEPMPVLRNVRVPMLWVLAAEDTEAPVAGTRSRLLELASEGQPVTLAVFPGTEHGIIDFEIGPGGERRSLRYADGYFRLVIDWLKTGRLDNPPYGAAEILAARGDRAFKRRP